MTWYSNKKLPKKQLQMGLEKKGHLNHIVADGTVELNISKQPGKYSAC